MYGQIVTASKGNALTYLEAMIRTTEDPPFQAKQGKCVKTCGDSDVRSPTGKSQRCVTWMRNRWTVMLVPVGSTFVTRSWYKTPSRKLQDRRCGKRYLVGKVGQYLEKCGEDTGAPAPKRGPSGRTNAILAEELRYSRTSA